VCGTGIGMSIAANKIAGVRAALVHDPVTARLAAMHNDANVLCLGGRLLAPEYALDLVEAWIGTAFEDRHSPRLLKITSLEATE
jgi:RpiB/LacA/LacB family sugar-phosphate isomerase